MSLRKSGRIIGAALAAVSLIGAGSSTVAVARGAQISQQSASTKPTLALNLAPRVNRSYKRRLILASGRIRHGGSPFVTKGNRAQRARQLSGMLAKNA